MPDQGPNIIRAGISGCGPDCFEDSISGASFWTRGFHDFGCFGHHWAAGACLSDHIWRIRIFGIADFYCVGQGHQLSDAPPPAWTGIRITDQKHCSCKRQR